MILSMGFGLIAAIGISQVMGRSGGSAVEAPKMGPVIVSADPLDLNSALTEESVTLENWPLDIIPENAATSLDEIKDKYINRRMSKGMPLIKSTIVTRQDLNKLPIPEGFRVVAIKVSGDSLVAGLLGPGDLVDVVGFFERRTRGGSKQTTTRTFLKALRVFSVNNKITVSEQREDGSTSSSGIVGVLVSQKQAEEIIHVMRTGSIQLVLRPMADMEGDDEVDSLEDILDWQNSSEIAATPTPVGPEAAPRTQFAAPESFAAQDSMIVWIGNSPEKVIFTPGALPQTTGQRRPGPPPREAMEVRAIREDFNGSDEIDRNLEQDQYRGE